MIIFTKEYWASVCRLNSRNHYNTYSMIYAMFMICKLNYFVYRYVAIVRPLQHRLSRTMARAALFTVWCAGTLLSLPSLIYSDTYKKQWVRAFSHQKDTVVDLDSSSRGSETLSLHKFHTFVPPWHDSVLSIMTIGTRQFLMWKLIYYATLYYPIENSVMKSQKSLISILLGTFFTYNRTVCVLRPYCSALIFCKVRCGLIPSHKIAYAHSQVSLPT